MKKKLIVIIFFNLIILLSATPSTPGFTGLIDYPTAYNLLQNNYTVTGILDNIEEETKFGVILEGGFIPQVEAGLKLSTSDKVLNNSLLKSNFKFQFVQEADNPAMAIGFVETEEVYAYLVATKTFKQFLQRKIMLQLSLGLKYDEDKETNTFLGVEIPLFEKIKFLGEVYTYGEEKIEEKGKDEKISYSLSGEFYTSRNIRTKVYWREKDDSFGISINYIGLYNKN